MPTNQLFQPTPQVHYPLFARHCCSPASTSLRPARKFKTSRLRQILRAHILPLTNCAFNKSGDKFITGSYDRTCKVAARGLVRAGSRAWVGVSGATYGYGLGLGLGSGSGRLGIFRVSIFCRGFFSLNTHKKTHQISLAKTVMLAGTRPHTN